MEISQILYRKAPKNIINYVSPDELWGPFVVSYPPGRESLGCQLSFRENICHWFMGQDRGIVISNPRNIEITDENSFSLDADNGDTTQTYIFRTLEEKDYKLVGLRERASLFDIYMVADLILSD
jgi:hypothetical protein